MYRRGQQSGTTSEGSWLKVELKIRDQWLQHHVKPLEERELVNIPSEQLGNGRTL